MLFFLLVTLTPFPLCTTTHICFLAIFVHWGTFRESAPHEIRTAKHVQTTAPQACALWGTLFGAGRAGEVSLCSTAAPGRSVSSCNNHDIGEEVECRCCMLTP